MVHTKGRGDFIRSFLRCPVGLFRAPDLLKCELKSNDLYIFYLQILFVILSIPVAFKQLIKLNLPPEYSRKKLTRAILIVYYLHVTNFTSFNMQKGV